MKLPDDIREFLKCKFKNKHREWLKASVCGDDSFRPLEINLGIPTERELLRQPDEVRAWIAAWRSWQGAGTLAWTKRRLQKMGTQSFPEKLVLNGPDDVASWIGEVARWTRAVDRFHTFIQKWPALINTLPKFFNVLADYDDTDLLRLFEMLSWLHTNPNSNLYPRQLPVTGIDSKWLESRKSLVSDLIAAIRGDDPSTDIDFFICCGLKPPPKLIRMRILDAALRIRFGGIGDISAPREEIAGLGITPANVFIVENLQTGLAFEDLKNSVVIMGLGYHVDVLGKIPWLCHAQCVYWGDIDTHGFAILNRAKSYLSDLKAVLMDEATLLNHRDLWVKEEKQHPADELPLLTDSEQKLFHALKNNVWGEKIRLEQERIRWDEAWKTILEMAGVEPAS